MMIAPSYPPNMGGVERHVFEVHRALQRLGMRGQVVVLKDRPPRLQDSPDVTWLGSRKLWGRVPKTTRLRMTWDLRRLVREINPRVVHLHDSYAMLPIVRLLGLLPRTYVTFHGWEGVCPVRPEAIATRQKVANRLRGNIAIGDFIPKWYGTEADFVNYGGVEVERYSAAAGEDADPDNRSMAYFGRFEQDTGILDVVEAVRRSNAGSDRPLLLDLYGMGSLEKRLVALCEQTSNAVRILPPVTDIAELLPKYRNVFVSGYLSILESLCAERTVCAYYHNRLREEYLRLHPAASSMFICGSVDDIIACLSLCRSDPPGVLSKCRGGWEWAKKQTWDSVARVYLKLWNCTP